MLSDEDGLDLEGFSGWSRVVVAVTIFLYICNTSPCFLEGIF